MFVEVETNSTEKKAVSAINIKMIPNILSISRIVLSLLLLLLEPLSVSFYVVYVYCIFSDIFDGVIARKQKLESKTGAMLDTVGDFVFAIAILITMFRCFMVPIWLVVWIAVILVVKVSSGVISTKRHSGVITHTILDKTSALLLVLIIPVVHILDIGLDIPAAVVCVVASIATIEDTAIAFSQRKVTPNSPSFFTLEHDDKT